MCMFCTAVPMTASLSIAAHANWKAKCKEAKAAGKTPPEFIPTMGEIATSAVGAVLGMFVVFLVIGAIVYHTTILPKTGV